MRATLLWSCVAILLAAVLLAVVFRREDAARTTDESDTADAGEVNDEAHVGAHRASAVRGPARRMLKPVAPAPSKEAPPRFFTDVCVGLSPGERCRATGSLATRCDAGDATACAAAAEAFFMPPVQPHLAAYFLAKACDLGDVDACARRQKLDLWTTWPALQQPGDRGPGESCEHGDAIACYYSGVNSINRDEAVDVSHAWKACEAGVADACSVVAQETRDPSVAVRALEVACRVRSPLHCGLLASMYDDGLVCCAEGDTGACFPCPEFDRARSEAYAAQVLDLTGLPYEPRYEHVEPLDAPD